MNDHNLSVTTDLSNHLLTSLPADVMERLQTRLEFVDAPLGMRLYDPYAPITSVHFPVNAMASIVASTVSGQSTEIGVVGPEGAVGLEVLMGSDRSPNRSMMQIAGAAYRIGVDEIKEEFRQCGAFHDHVLQFIQKLSVQVSQTTLCNRRHTVDERLPRWLLMCHDRIDGNVLQLTQEFIAVMLGSSRVTVTQAAQRFQQKGHIRYARGRITILDRAGLENAACDCYQIVKSEYDRKYL